MKRFLFFIILSVSYLLSAQSPVPPGAEVVKVAGGFGFLEGPVWNDSIGLLFSDMNNNLINNYTLDGKIKVFLKPSEVSNGLTYDRQGRLLVTQTELRRVVRIERNGTLTVLASGYNGKRLNSPNDIVCKSDGSIYFTDPTFNIPSGQHQELPFSGVYRISIISGKLQCLDSTLSLPNGICFSPDEKKLYVNDSQARIIYAWDISNDSILTNKKIFATIKPKGYADGMKTDPEGNLYSTGPLGVWIFSPDGNLMDTILVPETPSNCNWGGPDKKTLYITAQTGLYKIKLAGKTGIKGTGSVPVKSFRLFANYPNPFNPSTVISFEIIKSQYIRLKIYNALGDEISTLTEGYAAQGLHSYNFIASAFSSGVYYYRLYGSDGVQTKKLVFLK